MKCEQCRLNRVCPPRKMCSPCTQALISNPWVQARYEDCRAEADLKAFLKRQASFDASAPPMPKLRIVSRTRKKIVCDDVTPEPEFGKLKAGRKLKLTHSWRATRAMRREYHREMRKNQVDVRRGKRPTF